MSIENPTIEDLRMLQSLPLEIKVLQTINRLWEAVDRFGRNGVCVSFSGGKDSTVLLDIVRKEFGNDIKAVFVNTGLEYPEIQSFVKQYENVEIVRPKMRFDEVISKYGYPFVGKETAEAIYYARKIRSERERERERELRCVSEQNYLETERRRIQITGAETKPQSNNGSMLEGSAFDENWVGWRRRAFQNKVGERSIFNKEKWLPVARDLPIPFSHMCCSVMKKAPMRNIQSKLGVIPIIATTAEESRLRTQAWLRNGCNAFDTKHPHSTPMSFWLEQDTLRYIKENSLPIASVYGDVVSFDDLGNEYGETLIDCKLKCTGCNRTGCVFCGFGAHLEKGQNRFQRLAITHPKHYDYCMNGGQWVDNPNYDAAAPKMDGDWQNWNPKKIWVPSKEGLGMRYVIESLNDIYGKDFIAID